MDVGSVDGEDVAPRRWSGERAHRSGTCRPRQTRTRRRWSRSTDRCRSGGWLPEPGRSCRSALKMTLREETDVSRGLGATAAIELTVIGFTILIVCWAAVGVGWTLPALSVAML